MDEPAEDPEPFYLSRWPFLEPQWPPDDETE